MLEESNKNLMSPKIHLNKKAITVRIIVITFVNTSEINIAFKMELPNKLSHKIKTY